MLEYFVHAALRKRFTMLAVLYDHESCTSSTAPLCKATHSTRTNPQQTTADCIQCGVHPAITPVCPGYARTSGAGATAAAVVASGSSGPAPPAAPVAAAGRFWAPRAEVDEEDDGVEVAGARSMLRSATRKP